MTNPGVYLSDNFNFVLALFLTFYSLCVVFFTYYGCNEVRLENYKFDQAKYESLFKNLDENTKKLITGYLKYNDRGLYIAMILTALISFGLFIAYFKVIKDNVNESIENDPKSSESTYLKGIMNEYNKYIPYALCFIVFFTLFNVCTKFYDFCNTFYNPELLKEIKACGIQFRKSADISDLKKYITGTTILISTVILFLVFCFCYFVSVAFINWTEEEAKEEKLPVVLNVNRDSFSPISITCSVFLIFCFLVIAIFWPYWGCKILKIDNRISNCTGHWEILNEDRFNMISLVLITVAVILSLGLTVVQN